MHQPRVLANAIDLDDNTASLDLALNVIPYFELKEAGSTKHSMPQVCTNYYIQWYSTLFFDKLPAGLIDGDATAAGIRANKLEKA